MRDPVLNFKAALDPAVKPRDDEKMFVQDRSKTLSFFENTVFLPGILTTLFQ
jgi:hypothetical protein